MKNSSEQISGFTVQSPSSKRKNQNPIEDNSSAKLPRLDIEDPLRSNMSGSKTGENDSGNTPRPRLELRDFSTEDGRRNTEADFTALAKKLSHQTRNKIMERYQLINGTVAGVVLTQQDKEDIVEQVEFYVIIHSIVRDCLLQLGFSEDHREVHSALERKHERKESKS